MKPIKILLLLVTFYVTISSAYADDPKKSAYNLYALRDISVDNSETYNVVNQCIINNNKVINNIARYNSDQESFTLTLTKYLSDFHKKIQVSINKRFDDSLQVLRNTNQIERANNLKNIETIVKLELQIKEMQAIVNEQLNKILALESFIEGVQRDKRETTLYLPFSEKVGIVLLGDKYFYIDTNFQSLSNPIQYFEEARSFRNGSAIVKSGGQYYRVDKNLNKIVGSELYYDFIGEFFNERALVKTKDKKNKEVFGFIKTPDYALIGEGTIFYSADNFRAGVAPVKTQKKGAIGFLKPEKWGFIDLNGNVFGEKKADELRRVQEGYILERERRTGKKEQYFYNEKGQKITGRNPTFFPKEEFINGFIIIQDLNGRGGRKYGFMDREGAFLDESGKKTTKPNYLYSSAEPFSGEGMAMVQRLEQKGAYYINRLGQKVSLNYLNAYSFQNGKAVVQMANPAFYCLINTSFQIVSNQFSNMTDIGEGIVGVQDQSNTGWYFIDINTGNEICSERFKDVKVFSNGVCPVQHFAMSQQPTEMWGIMKKDCSSGSFGYHEAVGSKFEGGIFKFKKDNKEICVDVKGNEVVCDD
ncbi:MAG: WG repeat-containing protein [Cytophagales bacterium]|nr:MAG: WG repeat-containing protein [Cytophagales bacterium]